MPMPRAGPPEISYPAIASTSRVRSTPRWDGATPMAGGARLRRTRAAERAGEAGPRPVGAPIFRRRPGISAVSPLPELAPAAPDTRSTFRETVPSAFLGQHNSMSRASLAGGTDNEQVGCLSGRESTQICRKGNRSTAPAARNLRLDDPRGTQTWVIRQYHSRGRVIQVNIGKVAPVVRGTVCSRIAPDALGAFIAGESIRGT